MFKRFPELNQSMPPEPIPEGFLEGIVLVLTFCGLMYVLPVVGFIYLMLDRLHYTQYLGAIGVCLSVLAPLTWALYNPIGAWFVLLPIVAPPAFGSFLLFVNAKRRLYHRRNPTNLLTFKRRQGKPT